MTTSASTENSQGHKKTTKKKLFDSDWCLKTIYESTLVATNAAFFWLPRVAGADQLRGTKPTPMLKTLEREGPFPKTIAQVFSRQAHRRHQSVNTFIQLFINVMGIRATEKIVDHHGGFSNTAKVFSVGFVGALGASIGTRAIAQKSLKPSVKPSPSFLFFAIACETAREIGFYGCLESSNFIEKNMAGASDTEKVISHGVANAALAFLTGFPHAWAMSAYAGKPPTINKAVNKACGFRAAALTLTFSSAYVGEKVVSHCKSLQTKNYNC